MIDSTIRARSMTFLKNNGIYSKTYRHDKILKIKKEEIVNPINTGLNLQGILIDKNNQSIYPIGIRLSFLNNEHNMTISVNSFLGSLSNEYVFNKYFSIIKENDEEFLHNHILTFQRTINFEKSTHFFIKTYRAIIDCRFEVDDTIVGIINTIDLY